MWGFQPVICSVDRLEAYPTSKDLFIKFNYRVTLVGNPVGEKPTDCSLLAANALRPRLPVCFGVA